MIKTVFYKYFKNNSSFVTACVEKIDSPINGTNRLVKLHYKGDTTAFKDQIALCKKEGPLYINTVKMYHQADYKSFDVLGRIISGTIKKGDQVKIMG